MRDSNPLSSVTARRFNQLSYIHSEFQGWWYSPHLSPTVVTGAPWDLLGLSDKRRIGIRTQRRRTVTGNTPPGGCDESTAYSRPASFHYPVVFRLGEGQISKFLVQVGLEYPLVSLRLGDSFTWCLAPCSSVVAGYVLPCGCIG